MCWGRNGGQDFVLGRAPPNLLKTAPAYIYGSPTLKTLRLLYSVSILLPKVLHLNRPYYPIPTILRVKICRNPLDTYQF